MDRPVSYLDILEEVRRVMVEWMSTDDSLIKEHVYTSKAQRQNDKILEKTRNLAKKSIASGYIFSYQRVIDKGGVTGKMAEYCGSGATWLILKLWSRIFLTNHHHLGKPRSWFKMCVAFENQLKHFYIWLHRKYPNCCELELLKANRILWIASVLYHLYGHQEHENEEALFAWALLYPLVDNYMDMEQDDEIRRDFAKLLKAKLVDIRPGISAWSSSHPESKLVGELLETVRQPFRPSSSNRETALSMMDALIDLETDKFPQDILYSTTCKGGFTVCILNMLVTEKLPVLHVNTLLKLGLSLQVTDDLQDIQEDLAENTTTLATKSMYTHGELRSLYARSINFIRHRVFPKKIFDQKLNFDEGLKVLLCESMVLLCFEAVGSTVGLSPEDRITIMQHCPLSMEFLRSHPIEGTLHHLTSLIKK